MSIEKYCPNFNYIMEHLDKSDVISNKIINIYKSFIMRASKKTRSEIRKIKDFDYIIYVYLNDNFFHNLLNKKLPYLEFMVDGNYLFSLVDEIFKTYNAYTVYLSKKINDYKRIFDEKYKY